MFKKPEMKRRFLCIQNRFVHDDSYSHLIAAYQLSSQHVKLLSFLLSLYSIKIEDTVAIGTSVIKCITDSTLNINFRVINYMVNAM